MGHSNGQGDIKGLEAVKQSVTAWRTAFPDSRLTIDDVVIEGDRIAKRYTTSGTHKGLFKYPGGEIPATGRQIKVSGMEFFRVQNGRIIETFEFFDTLSFLQQLGLAPPPK